MKNKTKRMKCPRSWGHVPNWKGSKPKHLQKHASDTFYGSEWTKANFKKHKDILKQEVEFESVVGGLFWQCPVCKYMMRVSEEEADKVILEALSKALKKNLKEAGLSEVANKLDVEKFYYEPKKALNEVLK